MSHVSMVEDPGLVPDPPRLTPEQWWARQAHLRVLQSWHRPGTPAFESYGFRITECEVEARKCPAG